MGIKPSGDHPVIVPPDNVQSRWGAWEADLDASGQVAGEVFAETHAIANSANQWITEHSSELVGGDGQLGLNHRVDLLSPLLDYGSAFVPTWDRLHGTGYANFVEQIGPARGCEILTNGQGGFRLLEVGLWDIRVQLTVDWVLTSLDDTFRYEVRVFKPNGDMHSRQNFTIAESDATTGTVVSSVVVDEPGYRVRVYVTRNLPQRGILAGPAWSRLAVHHLSREVYGSWSDGSGTSDTPGG